MRPDVVLYEEPLNERTVGRAISEISEAQLLIIGGTSLAVYPAAAYLRCFGGEHIVLINRGSTDYDARAELVFRSSIGQIMSEIRNKI